MIQLNFRIETRPNGARVKIRNGTNDRLFGPCVADEAILWDAYQESKQYVCNLIEENKTLLEQLEAAQAKGRRK